MTKQQKLALRTQVFAALPKIDWATLAEVEDVTGLDAKSDCTARLLLHELTQAGVVEHDVAMNRYRRMPKRTSK